MQGFRKVYQNLFQNKNKIRKLLKKLRLLITKFSINKKDIPQKWLGTQYGGVLC
jgi:hypothetical protein